MFKQIGLAGEGLQGSAGGMGGQACLRSFHLL